MFATFSNRLATTMMYVQTRELFQSYPDQLEPFLVFNNTAFNRSNFLQMLPEIEVQIFCKRVVEIDNSDPPEYVKAQLDLDKMVCVQPLKREKTSGVVAFGYRKFRKADGAEIPIGNLEFLLFSMLYVLPETKLFPSPDWNYYNSLNLERFCVQIILAFQSNPTLVYQDRMMNELTGCLKMNKLLYAMSIIKEYNPNFSFCIPLEGKGLNINNKQAVAAAAAAAADGGK
jgi:hypothetical protein